MDLKQELGIGEDFMYVNTRLRKGGAIVEIKNNSHYSSLTVEFLHLDKEKVKEILVAIKPFIEEEINN